MNISRRPPNIGRKLWWRKFVQNISLKARAAIKGNTLQNILSLAIALIGLYFAFKANSIGKHANQLAETQLKMQRTDTSQQSQISKLTEIILELRQEQDLNNKQNQIIEQLRVTAALQSQTARSQLTITQKSVSKLDKSDSLTEKAGMLSIISTFDELADFRRIRYAVSLEKQPVGQRLQIVTSIKKILEKEIQNKALLGNPQLKSVWMKFYDINANCEFEMIVYELGTRSSIKDETQHNALAKLYSEKYLAFVNDMFKIKIAFLKTI